MASCNYYQYGAAGGQSKLNALCILALNVIIDKIYLILWAWYAILITLGIVRMIERSDLLFYKWEIIGSCNTGFYSSCLGASAIS